MLVLGIESTCDETSIALVKEGKHILSHVTASSAEVQSTFGGVVPELASRHHVTLILPCLQQALKEANVSLKDIDLIACSEGPGLIGSLLVGIRTGQALSWMLNKPLLGVNHIEAHMYAALMSDPHFEHRLPAMGCVLSGGHTSLILIHDVGRYTLLGQTIDDAIGEAFDKTAKMLGLPYPGGPQIEALAKLGDPKRFPLKAGQVKNAPYSFSFSGLKTAVLYTLQKQKLQEEEKANMAASFQDAAFSDVLKKIRLAIEEFPVSALYFGGGVTHNKKLRERANIEISTPSFFPREELCLDNGAMIAGLGFHVSQRGNSSMTYTLSPKTRIPFE
jgi:N6-L-threonylcarbamoyladenine synthase